MGDLTHQKDLIFLSPLLRCRNRGPAAARRGRRNFPRVSALAQQQAMLLQLTMDDAMPRCVFFPHRPHPRKIDDHAHTAVPFPPFAPPTDSACACAPFQGDAVLSGRVIRSRECAARVVDPFCASFSVSSSSQDRRSCSAVSRNRESVAAVSSDAKRDCNLARESSKTN